jgi:hypothetical protein
MKVFKRKSYKFVFSSFTIDDVMMTNLNSLNPRGKHRSSGSCIGVRLSGAYEE